MNIDYKKEVDSGYDRKVIIEKTIKKLLKDGFPVEIVAENPNFNFNHEEMLRNLTNGFYSKEDELKERIDGQPFRQNSQLSEAYSEVVHTIQELYPMTEKEEQEIFAKRDELNTQIEKAKTEEALAQNKNVSELIDKIAKLKSTHPVIDKMIEFQTEMAEISKSKTISYEELDKLFHKYGFNKTNFIEYQNMYLTYDKLVNDLASIKGDISSEKLNNITNREIERLIDKRNAIEDEIVSRNLKLVNFFIRKIYGSLLVEQEEIYCVCLEALAKAIKEFDVKLGYRFSTFAFKYMDIQVKSNFIELTGKKWDVYWKIEKIKRTKRIISDFINRTPTAEELVDMGFLDMSKANAEYYESIPEFILSSYLDSNRKSLNPIDDEVDMDNPLNYYDQNEINEIEEQIFAGQLKEDIDKVLDTLTPREKEIIILRFGLRGGTTKSLDELSETFGYTRERIRQIEAKALRKLHQPQRAEKLKDYLK